jgi:hypothetical protein
MRLMQIVWNAGQRPVIKPDGLEPATVASAASFS